MAPEPPPHIAVMEREVVAYLAPRPGGTYVDCTLGAGGHSRLIAAAMAGQGRLLGLDKDPVALATASRVMAEAGVAWEAIPSDFGQLGEVLAARGLERVDGVVADLGLSSMQLHGAERGFSFAAEGPLDMRMDPRQPLTAEQVVNQADERELADLIFQFGEERRSRRIARAIVRSRPLHTTKQLADLVAAVNRPMKSDRGRRGLHPATRTFQALRIYVNSELESLAGLLDFVERGLNPGGRAVVIAFHSLEDRPVKQRFRALAQAGGWQLLTRHAVRPEPAETERNPRARSARLRAIEKLAEGA